LSRNAENQVHPLANHFIISSFGLSARKSRGRAQAVQPTGIGLSLKKLKLMKPMMKVFHCTPFVTGTKVS
jgi:hypothetical protein